MATISINDIQIFITTYNRAEYLQESIESILNQSAGVCEVTVLDNDSTDNTRQIVEQYKEKDVRYVRTSGFLGNYKKAREIASKKFVMLFHDDDLLHYDYLALVLDELNKNDNIALLTTRYTEFTDDKKPEWSDIGADRYLFDTQCAFADFLYFNEIVAYAPAVYKTEYFLKVDLEYDRFSKFNDWPLLVKMAAFGQAVIFKDPKIFYVRRHPQQDTWLEKNSPSLRQIVNWDMFFSEVMDIEHSNFDLQNKFVKKMLGYSVGKFRAFLSTADKQIYSLSDLSQEIAREFDFIHDKILLPHLLEMKDYLEIILVTYNRRKYLENTFKQIFADDSPIRKLEITVLDNCSDDGTAELIAEYQQRFSNLKHVVHNRNIGGNANITRAYEMAKKEYIWVLCDDDRYDWSNWSEVNEAIWEGKEAICVADYVFENKYPKTSVPHQLFQLTFVPAGIYKTSLLTSTVIANMYDLIHASFPQSCVAISLVNHGGAIHVLDKPIVFNGQDDEVDLSYTRGSAKTDVFYKRVNFHWTWGYANVCALLKDKELMERSFSVPLSNLNIVLSEDDWGRFIAEEYYSKPQLRAMFDDIWYCCNASLRRHVDAFCSQKTRSRFVYQAGGNYTLKIGSAKIRVWSKKWFSKK